MTEEDWTHGRFDEGALERGARAIADRHGLPGALARFEGGSLPVYGVGDAHVLKLFGPGEPELHQTEAQVLRAIEGRLAIPTPALVAADELAGVRYVLMTRCRGVPLRSVAASIGRSGLESLVAEVGRALANLHAIDPASSGLEDDWAAFITAQRAQVVERQRAHGLGEEWLSQIEGFLSSVDLEAGATPRVLMHTEVMQEHLLVAPIDERWCCTGLIDFEPAMIGDARYEFASVGLFLTEGDAGLLSTLLDGYTAASARINRADPSSLAREIMAFALLHRYSKLRWYLERVPPPPGVDTLDALARHWFGGSPVTAG